MILMIVAIDQLVWRPLIVWSNKFKIEDTEAEYQDRSAVLRFFNRSRVVAWIHKKFSSVVMRPAPIKLAAVPAPVVPRSKPSQFLTVIPWRKIFLVLSVALIAY